MGDEAKTDLDFKRGDRVRVIDMSDAPFPEVTGLVGVVVSIVEPPVHTNMFEPPTRAKPVYYVRIGDQVFALHDNEIEFD